MWLYCLSVSFLLVLSRDVSCILQPSFPGSSTIGNSESRGLSFPDDGRTGSCPHPFHFIGGLSFLSDVTGNLLIGSADVLFMLNETTLSCVDSYLWESDSALSSMCSGQEICRNYIRLYQKLPSESSRLFVCGTQSGITPQCRTVQFTDVGFNSATGTVGASANLISNLPDLHQFGEFVERTTTSMDTLYLSGAFFEVDERRNIFGADYNISFHRVSYNNGALSVTALFRLKDGPSWLLYPVMLVDFYRADYVVDGVNVEYYFLFVREALPGVLPELVNSRVVRICRNDPGADGQFTTFIKSGILCEYATPPSREFIGAADYQYNDITSMVFNDDGGGRYAESENWLRLMYGAFSGPRLGPRGTAICVYRADYGMNSGIVGIFNDDLIRDNVDGTTTVLRNSFPTCPAGGRPQPASSEIRTAHDIEQLVPPLVIFDGIVVTQMVLDRVCIVRKTSNTSCLNQDVLFLGTDTGTIMKVVFTTSTPSRTEPVVSEEISLGDNSGVDDMAIREDAAGVKFLFVSTVTKVHRFPLERCLRLVGCQACIGARDPYCVWDNLNQLCVRNNISATADASGMVPEQIWQNIHTGSVDQCNVQVNCVVAAVAVNHQSIMCLAGCNGTDTVNISTSLPSPTSTDCSSNDSSSSVSDCKIFTSSQGLGLHSYDCIAESLSSASVLYSASVQTSPGPPTPFEDYSSCGQTFCTVCVQVTDFTDFFSNYAFEVYYSSDSMSIFETTPAKNLSEDSGCVVLRSLLPGTSLNYTVELQNNVSALNSTQKTVSLLEGFSGPVENIQIEMVTNVSITLSWSPPSVRNGIISGYSVYVNTTAVLSCAEKFTGTRYSVNNLMPVTYYMMTVHACTGAGESNVSAGRISQTSCGTPSSVVNVTIESRTSDRITFEWDRPVHYNGNISNTEYEVMTFVYGVNGIVSSRNNIEDSLYHLEDISPRTLCCADIYAVSSCNNFRFIGPPSRLCGQTLHALPEPVSNLMVPNHTIGIGSFSLMWDPPPNLITTPGVTYNVAINNRSLRDLTDATFLYIKDLSPCTRYTVEVIACFSGQSGAESMTSVTTKSLLPPPENVKFLINENGMFALMWLRPSERVCEDSIQRYRLSLRCNQFVNEIEISSSLSSIVTDIPDESLGIGWCVARMQSCDADLRCGNFSSEATVSLYQSPPSQPRCLLSQSSSTNVSITFVVSQPFITNSTRVEWNLTSTSSFDSESYGYNVSSTNILDFAVDSNSDYDFMLKICDIYGCSSPCVIAFKTLDIPAPPQNIEVTNITNTSALLTWRSANDQNLSYTISLASACPTGNFLIRGIIGTDFSIRNLCPNSNYTIVIRATDLRVNKSSLYSDITDFATPAGIPTKPRYVDGVFNKDAETIRVTWVIPVELNGVIDKYEVRWTFSTLRCDEDNQGVLSKKTKNASIFEFIIDTRGNENIVSYSVCVRATTATTVGSWEIDMVIDANKDSLTTLPEDCNTLTAVACVAALTVAASLIMSVILSISIIQKGWFFCKNDVHGEKN